MSSPSQHVRHCEYHTSVRIRVHSLYNDAHYSKKRIAFKLNISCSSVQFILSTSAQRCSSTTRTRSLILSEFNIQMMIQKVTTSFLNRTYTWKELAAFIDRFDVFENTARRYMHAADFKKCKACRHSFINVVAVTKRLFWINTKNRWKQELEYWMNWAWSDEVTFTTDMQGTKYVIRTSGDRHNSDCAQNQYRSGRASFSCWGAVEWYWKSPLMFVKGHGRRGGFTQEDYAAQVINAVVGPFFLKTRLFNAGQFVLYEDGNSAHGLTVNSTENAARRCKEAWNITYVAVVGWISHPP